MESIFINVGISAILELLKQIPAIEKLRLKYRPVMLKIAAYINLGFEADGEFQKDVKMKVTEIKKKAAAEAKKKK